MSSPTITTAVPPLRDGERLTREEFHRRYLAVTPHVKGWELIEGVVHMPSPVRVNHHGSPHARLISWLGNYEAATPGVQAMAAGTVILDDENEPHPDATLFVVPPHAAHARVTEDDYLDGPPEFVAEVSASTERIDLVAKFGVYQRRGIREYLVWRVGAVRIDWFVLRPDGYQPLAPHADRTLRSEAFPGLWLDPAALPGGDLARVLAALRAGTATPEHAAFVRSLTPPGSGIMSPTP
ncbi:MAG: Uma2 family endonuclease [Gemmataceae bacterium]